MTTHTGFPVTLDGETFLETEFTANGGTGYATRLPQMMTAGAADLAAKVAQATTQVTLATTQATNAANSAQTAINAPATAGTSTTTLTVAVGSQTLTTQPGKSIIPGATVQIAYAVTPSTWMTGTVTAYNVGTGSLTVNVTTISGTGTYASWTVFVLQLWVVKNAAYTAVSGDFIFADTTAAAFTITLPASPGVNSTVSIADYAEKFSTNNLTIARNGSKIMGLLEDMTVSTNNVSLILTYIDATQGWRLI